MVNCLFNRKGQDGMGKGCMVCCGLIILLLIIFVAFRFLGGVSIF